MHFWDLLCLLQLVWIAKAGYYASMGPDNDYDGDTGGGMDGYENNVHIRAHKVMGTYGSALHCKINIPKETSDVNRLSPFNVEVVAALGDSLTAALGAEAETPFGLFFEYKGVSWSIGGTSTLSKVTTLPNILKMFNPNLLGFSRHLKLLRQTEALNRAVTGAHVKNLLGQAQDLVHQMGRLTGMRKWKVITIFIGSNDLCDESTCKNSESTTVENYMEHLHKALYYLSRNVKYAFINLALLLDVSILAPVKGYCDFWHKSFCSCAVDSNPKLASRVAKSINSAIIEQFQKKQPYDRKDFAVVVQPMYSRTQLPYITKESWWKKRKSQTKRQLWGRRYKKTVPDKSYFAPDCFHFSQKAHTFAATLLWNNMLQPFGKKTEEVSWNQERKLLCPDNNFPYFRTNSNSKLVQ